MSSSKWRHGLIPFFQLYIALVSKIKFLCRLDSLICGWFDLFVLYQDAKIQQSMVVKMVILLASAVVVDLRTIQTWCFRSIGSAIEWATIDLPWLLISGWWTSSEQWTWIATLVRTCTQPTRSFSWEWLWAKPSLAQKKFLPHKSGLFFHGRISWCSRRFGCRHGPWRQAPLPPLKNLFVRIVTRCQLVIHRFPSLKEAK